MSTPILPFAVWASGTNQNSIPANDNSLRSQILNGNIIADDVTAQPGSPDDGDAYIIPNGATGAQWETFDENDLVIYQSGTWYAYAPVEGIRLTVAGEMKQWDGDSYEIIGGLSDAPSDGTGYVRKNGAWAAESGGGSGDVVGPASSTDGHVALFDGVTGKLLKDGGALADVATSGDAADVAIADAGGYFTATDVEGALQELGAGGGGGGGLTNWSESVNSSAPNATVPVVSLTALNAETNVDVAICPKGSGAILIAVPDGTPTGGNKRGARATDLQSQRGNAAQVASGLNSTIIGGRNCTASGSYSIAGGDGASAGGNYALAFGGANTSSGTGNACIGGANNSASRDYSTTTGGFGLVADGHYSRVGGREAVARTRTGVDVFASGQINDLGDAQVSNCVLRRRTTSATPAVITTNGASATAAGLILLPNNAAYIVRGDIIARQDSTGDCKSWEFRVTVKRGANAASTAIVGTAVLTVCDADSGAAAWDVEIGVDTTYGALSLTGTGEASKTIKWVASARSVEVTG